MADILVLAAVNAVLLFAMFLYVKRKIRIALGSENLLREIREEVDGILRELNQTTDRNIRLIEDRVERLMEIMAKADKRIGVMQREVEKQDMGRNVYQQLLDKKRQSGATTSAHTDGEQSRDAADPAEPRKSVREQVGELHDKGIAPDLIAKRVGTTVGEVELIISLRERKG
jgi:uncharacterized protein YoxC